MASQWMFLEVFSVLVVVGYSQNVEVSYEGSNGGFFLKPLHSKVETFRPTIQRQPLVITKLDEPNTVKAAFGPFVTFENVSSNLVLGSKGNGSDVSFKYPPGNMDVSAHIVDRTVTQDRPVLQVLFHTSQKASSTGRTGASKWCLQMFVQKLDTEIASVCVINDNENVCIAETMLPIAWWDDPKSHNAHVYYSVYSVDENIQCSSATNSIVPGKSILGTQVKSKIFVNNITLTRGEIPYRELQEDQHILIYVPQQTFFPGARFRVPIKLQAESDLQLFIVRTRARHGLRVVGAEATNPTKWRISVDPSHKQKSAMVTAYTQDKNTYVKSPKVQPIFDMIFEVEKDVTGHELGRVTLNLEYEMNMQMKEKYGTIVNRVSARISIQGDHTYAIVPVLKSRELLNMALLTGTQAVHPMKIFAVSQAGKVEEVTDETTCHSGDENVIKVDQHCSYIYLNGKETQGSDNIHIIAKYSRHTAFLYLRVWVPELPLDVDLSDTKLSQVKAWKAPKEHTRKKRGTEPKGTPEETQTSCHLRFQQSVVEIFVRFFVPDGNRKLYYLNRKAYLQVTDLVKARLRVADTSIAALNEKVIEGLRPGRTEVQVLSASGRVIGAREIKVGNDKVTVDKLEVTVVTGLSMTIEEDQDMEGVLSAHVHIKERLQKKYQEGILDITVHFSDETSIPLHFIPDNAYELSMDALSSRVIDITEPPLSKTLPRVIAVGEGKGELLKLSLDLGEKCQRKKSRSKPLMVSYVYINSDFSTDGDYDEGLQNDGHYNSNNRASDRWETKKDGSDHIIYHHIDVGTKKNQPEDQVVNVKPQPPNDHNDPKTEQNLKIPLDIDLGDLPQSKPRTEEMASQEAQLQHVGGAHASKMTPLEIGMYVLLAVFCVAIVVFMVNCIVFVVRYRRKRMPRDSHESISQANDWVWIGRATLERNAVNTGCRQQLMPDSDFNGNNNLENGTTGTNGTNGRASVKRVVAPSSNRNSAASGSSGGGGGGGGGGSNRNSTVSTYKGSECSIRITSNPHPDSQNPNNPNQQDIEWDYEAMGMTYDQLMEYFDNLKESTA